MQNVVSKMNRNAANHAATTEKLLPVVRENISQPSAPIADKMRKFPSNPKQTDLYIAAIVSQKQGNKQHATNNEGHYYS